jgi:hypothetical protein
MFGFILFAKFMGTQAFAENVGLQLETVERLIACGTIPAIKEGRKFFVSPDVFASLRQLAQEQSDARWQAAQPLSDADKRAHAALAEVAHAY